MFIISEIIVQSTKKRGGVRMAFCRLAKSKFMFSSYLCNGITFAHMLKACKEDYDYFFGNKACWMSKKILLTFKKKFLLFFFYDPSVYF